MAVIGISIVHNAYHDVLLQESWGGIFSFGESIIGTSEMVVLYVQKYYIFRGGWVAKNRWDARCNAKKITLDGRRIGYFSSQFLVSLK